MVTKKNLPGFNAVVPVSNIDNANCNSTFEKNFLIRDRIIPIRQHASKLPIFASYDAIEMAGITNPPHKSPPNFGLICHPSCITAGKICVQSGYQDQVNCQTWKSCVQNIPGCSNL